MLGCHGQILFYSKVSILSVSPDRTVKDCGESSPGARDCGWGAEAVVDAKDTLCGRSSSCQVGSECDMSSFGDYCLHHC